MEGQTIQQERTRLTQEELDSIIGKELHSGRLNQVRDIFVFCCYTGLAYVDVYNLTENHLIEEGGRVYLQTSRQKTNSPVYVPLLQPALDILAKYENYPGRKIEGRLLPVKSNQKMNSYLKEIAGLCGIEKTVTFHVARHTFATTILLANDVPIETVKELLGHKDIQTTQHYAKMIQKKVDRDMDNLASQVGISFRLPTNLAINLAIRLLFDYNSSAFFKLHIICYGRAIYIKNPDEVIRVIFRCLRNKIPFSTTYR